MLTNKEYKDALDALIKAIGAEKANTIMDLVASDIGHELLDFGLGDILKWQLWCRDDVVNTCEDYDEDITLDEVDTICEKFRNAGCLDTENGWDMINGCIGEVLEERKGATA